MISGLQDILTGLKRWHLWLALAVDDFRSRFHRTILGPVWITLTFVAFVAVKIFIFSAMGVSDFNYYVAHLTLGFAIWNYISGSLNTGSIALVSSRNWILGIRTPYSIFQYQAITSNMMSFVFSAIAALIFSTIYFEYSLISLIYSFFGLIFITFTLFWVQFSLSLLCVLFRDLVQVVSTVLRVSFFLTPIIWIPSDIGVKAEFLVYNPFAYLLSAVRDPIMKGEVSLMTWYVLGIITILSMISTLVLYGLIAKRVPSYV